MYKAVVAESKKLKFAKYLLSEQVFVLLQGAEFENITFENLLQKLFIK